MACPLQRLTPADVYTTAASACCTRPIPCTDPSRLSLSFLHILQQLRASHTCPDVVLGVDVGAPPLPAAACVRLGLLDVVHNLQQLAETDRVPLLLSGAEPVGAASASNSSSSGSARAPLKADAAAEGGTGGCSVSGSAFNAAVAAVWPDWYYDLSSLHSSHLEVPCRLNEDSVLVGAVAAPPSAAKQQESGSSSRRGSAGVHAAGSAAAVSSFKQLAQGLQGLLVGRPFLRSLQYVQPSYSTCSSNTSSSSSTAGSTPGCGAPQASAATYGASGLLGAAAAAAAAVQGSAEVHLEPSVHRGGCTFILNAAALKVPQHAFAARRSDMLWCLACKRRA
jgi:hypothetical protein